VVSGSTKNGKGLSSAPVRPTRLLPVPLFLAAALLVLGCSEKVQTVVGNERLIRGPDGLGTTSSSTPGPDRDTYAAPDSANRDRSLLVGNYASIQFQSKSYFAAPSAWTLPDTNLTGFTVDSVFFQLDQAPLRIPPVSGVLQLNETASSWDTTTVTWPGPANGAFLGSATFDFIGPLRISLGAGAFTLIKQWAIDPSSLAGLVLTGPTLSLGTGFRNHTGTVQVRYRYQSGAAPESAYAVTHLFRDFYLNSPVTPAPTGGDTELMLGGGYQAAVAIKVPVPASTPGFSLNEARLVFSVASTFPAVDGTTFNPGSGAVGDTARVSVTIDCFRITEDWTESTTDITAFKHDALPVSFVIDQAPAAGDSLSIPLPAFLVRAWSADSTTNKGVLLEVRSANVKPGMFLGSRESASPPVLRLAYTSPPPYRF
jgi:hypothetical protein